MLHVAAVVHRAIGSRVLGLGLGGLLLCAARPAGATGSESALTVAVSVVRPCLIAPLSGPGDAHAESLPGEAWLRNTRASLEASCAASEPRIELSNVAAVTMGTSTQTLDIEF